MLNEQMYILWQQIKYFANTYTNIWYLGFSFAYLFTFITFLTFYNRAFLNEKTLGFNASAQQFPNF